VKKVKSAAIVLGLLLSCGAQALAQGPDRQYECERIWPGTISVDGKLDEPAWKVAFGVDLADSTTGNQPAQSTQAKLLWDSRYLYVAFTCQDRDAWGTLAKRDDPVFTQEAVEVFIAPHGPAQPYYEFDANPLGTLFDTIVEDKNLFGAQSDRWVHTFNSQAKCAVHVDGTVNDCLGPDEHLPQPGDSWRLNLYRIDLPRGAAQQELSAWSPTGSSFHVPDKFGKIVFRDTFFYSCHNVKPGSIKVDGVLDENEWQKAPPVGRFRETYTLKYAKQGTVAKMLWDQENLYLGFEVEDKDVWATLKLRDQDLMNEEVVEAFIAPPQIPKGYFEFEFSPLGTILDILVFNPTDGVYSGMYFNNRYDAKGLVLAVKVHGTLDNRDDVDQGWTAEVAIPFADMVGMGNQRPSVGDVWRIGLYRCEVGKQKEDTEYTAWSPTASWFHVPSQFGTIAFLEGQ
jgi:hypothetical protein